MTTKLNPILINDTQLFKVAVYNTDGVTKVTPISCTCTIFETLSGAEVVSGAAGTVGLGYAQYIWTGSATPTQFEAHLTVTITSENVRTEVFQITVLEKPIEFTTDLDTEVGQVRFEIGDDTYGSGQKPDGSNFTDEQLLMLYTREGSVMRAAAAVCETLSRLWSGVATLQIGPRKEELGAIAKQWSDRAAQLRTTYGYGTATGAESANVFSVGVKRSDEWTQQGE